MFPDKRTASFLILPLLAGLGVNTASAGGPRWVAGSSYFDPSTLGKSIVWKNGVVNYYTDLGDLSATVNQAQANAMVAAAAAQWSGIPTAALQINAAGSLAEDVNGSNFYNHGSGLVEPADVASAATETPVGIIYDADGSVIDALEGEGASDPNSCNVSGVITLVDNFAADATIAHALIIVNGRCTTDAAHIALVQYELLRGFGRILGLDWSQANDWMFPGNTTPDGLLGWPLMHPVEKLCNSDGNPCMTGTISPRLDDVAALNRLYPVDLGNASNFPDKTVTATATISIRGTVYFLTGQGMQGVNVVATPLIPGTDEPDTRYPTATVSGALYTGNAGNLVTGWVDSSGYSLSRFGTFTATDEGAYDLSGIPLPPDQTQADYQLTFEAVNPLYTSGESVGPYTLGQVIPSGVLPTVILRGLSAGSSVLQDETLENSAVDANSGADGTEAAPVPVPVTGQWMARLSGHGHSSWLRWRVRGGRQVTVEAQPIDSEGRETGNKARLVTGVWNGDDALGTAPDVDTPQPFNAVPTGLTTLSFESANDGDVRIALADQRGDGRPDYLYRGRVLYADTVTPQRIPVTGGPIIIDGSGFRTGSSVTIGGVAAQITSLTPMEITAIAPASAGAQTGNVDITVTDPMTAGWATIEGASGTGLSYDAATADQLITLTAPLNAVLIGVPLPFTVRGFEANGTTPAAGVSVTYTVTQGEATLACGRVSCTVPASGDGTASLMVTASNPALAVVTASLSNGSSVLTAFIGAAPPQIAALSGTIYLAAGSIFNWTPRVVVLSSGLPYAGQTVTWTSAKGATVSSPSTISDAAGMAWAQATAGPLLIGATASVNACLAGAALNGPGCAGFSVLGADASIAALSAVSGTNQRLSPGDPLQPAVLQVSDSSGHPMAGGVVTFYETLRQWSPPCSGGGDCPVAPVLQRQTVQVVSSAAGLVSLTPLTDGIVPTQLEVVATIGNTATLDIVVDRHP
jgi:hypothetical protein